MNIPKDPIILLSYINTKLRDEFSSLTELCQSINVDQTLLMNTLSNIHYIYDEEQNRFIAQ